MALYVYKKKNITTQQSRKSTLTALLSNRLAYRRKGPQPEKDFSNWATYKAIYNLRRSHTFRLILPVALIITGLSMLYSQIHPYAKHFVVAQFTDHFNQGIISAVSDTYEQERFKYITDPGASYFADYMSHLTQTTRQEDNFSRTYNGTFSLSINEIGLENAPVTANVDSSNNEQYQQALSKGLAHMQGTKVPGATDNQQENILGNIFVYGHSSSGLINENDPVVAFTNLFKLNIGDEIVLERDGFEYVYKVIKIKEISPNDTSVVDNTQGDTLTLMTCSPPGLAIRRLIVVSRFTEVRSGGIDT